MKETKCVYCTDWESNFLHRTYNSKTELKPTCNECSEIITNMLLKDKKLINT